MRIASVNVNGIRAAVRRGMLTWLAGCGADIVALQEVRATPKQWTTTLKDTPWARVDHVTANGVQTETSKTPPPENTSEWRVLLHDSNTAGRAGVALLLRPGLKVGTPTVGLAAPTHSEFLEFSQAAATDEGRPNSEGRVFMSSGRWLELPVQTTSGTVTVVSAYFHSGDETRPEVMAEKYALLETVTARLEHAKTNSEHIILIGDLNIAHKELDIKNHKGNVGKAGFLPQERTYFDRWFTTELVADVGRAAVGEIPGPYTWWSYRGKAFDNDAGWRIDYHFVSPPLLPLASGYTVTRADSYESRWSDHAPVSADYAL